jgi:hypothetical protein
MKIQKTALVHDSGLVYAVGAENECLFKLHSVSGQSLDYSLKTEWNGHKPGDITN